MEITTHNGITINSDDIKKEDMPSTLFQEIYELCGVETALKLLKYMVGNLIQVPTRGFINIEKRLILDRYDGTTASLRAIARDLKVPENFIRKVLSESRIQVPVDGQIGLFDEVANAK